MGVWAIVPAAGMGRRMGRPKQVLPYRGSTLTGAVVRSLLDAGPDGIVVVTRTPLVAELDLPHDPRIEIALNDDSESEMIDSIRIGLAALRRASSGDGVLVVPSDMPDIPPAAYRRCVETYLADPQRIVIATHKGHRSHPIVFPFSMRGAIERLDGGLNNLPRTYPETLHAVEIADPSVARDVDNAQDYRSLSGHTPKATFRRDERGPDSV